MSSDMSKCVNFSVFLDIARVLKDAPTQKHQKYTKFYYNNIRSN